MLGSPPSAGELRLRAERLLIRAAGSFVSERRSRRLRDRSHILLEAATLADRREFSDKKQRAALAREADTLHEEAST